MAEETIPDTFSAYTEERDKARFTNWLRERSEPAWTNATRHQFVQELGDDTLDDEVFRRYLIQDYAYLKTGASAAGYAVAQAPTMDAKARFTEQLTVLTGGENDYFQRAFDALGVPETNRTDPSLTPVTETFCDFRIRAALEGGYVETVTVTLAGEWIYLDWATHVAERSLSRFYLKEWVELHTTPDFEEYVSWLRDQLNEYGPTVSARRQDRIDELFQRTVDLEVAFFDVLRRIYIDLRR